MYVPKNNLKAVNVVGLPYWTVQAMRSIDPDLAIFRDKGLAGYEGKISGSDYNDGIVVTHNLESILKIPVVNRIYDWKVDFTDSSAYYSDIDDANRTSLRNILALLNGISPDDAYSVDILSTDLVLITMKQGFNVSLEHGSSTLKDLYTAILNELFKIVSFSDVANTGLFKKYLTV